MNIILCGYKNCGKTTLGLALAKKFNKPFMDTDQCVLKRTDAQDIRTLCMNLGEKAFRDLEKNFIQSITVDNSIIALGGGALLNKDVANYLAEVGKIFYLYLPDNEIKRRMLSQVNLPSFIDPTDPIDSVNKYLESRRGLYECYADETIDLTGLSIEQSINKFEKYNGK